MKVLIITRSQFGYLIDYYHYCCHCPSDISVDYIGIDVGQPEIKLNKDNVNVFGVKRRSGSFWDKLLSQVRFRCFCVFKILKGHYDLVFVNYFPGCSILRIFTGSRVILDIRTGSVAISRRKRVLQNFLVRVESIFFSRITILSRSLAELLHLPERKFVILPLGADILDLQDRCYDELNLIYVGTFNGRDLKKTLDGLCLFHSAHPFVKFSYDIIGKGTPQEEKILYESAQDPRISGKVFFHGFVHHSLISSYLLRANLGISFIPIDDRYNCQPATKTFEYLGAGMPVIATATYENKLIINNTNGVLCDDSASSFFEALEAFWIRRLQFDSKILKASIKGYTWPDITDYLYDLWRDFKK